MKRQIAKNLVSNYGVNGASLLVGFMLVPFLIHTLGAKAFGLIMLAESAIGFFEIGTISVRIALSRHAAFALAGGKKGDFEQFLSTGRCILFVSAAVVLAAGLALSLNFDRVFNVPAELAMQSRWMFSFIIVSFAITVPNVVYWSVLYAKERFDLINVSMSVGLLIRAIALFAAYSFLAPEHRTLGVYGVIYLAMIWAQNLLVWFWHRRIMPGLSLGMQHFRRDKVREILSLSGHTTLSRVSILLYDNTAAFVINLFWGPAANAVYAVSLKIPQVIKRFFGDTTWTLTPTFTNLAARDDKRRLKALFFGYTKMMTLVTAPALIALAVFSVPLVELWVGKDFELAGKLLPLHLLPMIMGLPFAVCGCITNAYAEVKIPSRVGFTTGVFNVIIGVLLGHVFGMGIYGIAIAALLMNLVYVTAFSPFYACRIAGFSVGEYWVNGFFKPFATAFATLAAPLIAFEAFGFAPAFTPPWVAAAFCLAAAYAAGAYAFVFNADERAKVRDLFRALSVFARENGQPRPLIEETRP